LICWACFINLKTSLLVTLLFLTTFSFSQNKVKPEKLKFTDTHYPVNLSVGFHAGKHEKATAGLGFVAFKPLPMGRSKGFGALVGISAYISQTQTTTTSHYGYWTESNTGRYYGCNLDLGVIRRISKKQLNHHPNANAFLEFGFKYSAPVFFKFVSINRQDEQPRESIHFWNDTRFIANANYRKLGMNITYRLVDFVRREYAQVPRFQIGLNYNLAVWVPVTMFKEHLDK
jgi:hypothetical protein